MSIEQPPIGVEEDVAKKMARAFIESNPSVETCDKRDQEFLQNLLTLAEADPDIVRRVVIMRHKLNNGINLTQAEAEELLCVLKCKGFDHVDLNLDGLKFPRLDMERAVVGGNLSQRFCVVEADNLQWDMQVGGNNWQEGMRVGGDNWQEGMRVGGNNWQEGMRVGGHNAQHGMQVGGHNAQQRMQVGGDNAQQRMQVGGNNDQQRMQVGGNNNQQRMQVGGNNDQEGMQVEGDNQQEGMQKGEANLQNRIQRWWQKLLLKLR